MPSSPLSSNGCFHLIEKKLHSTLLSQQGGSIGTHHLRVFWHSDCLFQGSVQAQSNVLTVVAFGDKKSNLRFSKDGTHVRYLDIPLALERLGAKPVELISHFPAALAYWSSRILKP